MECIPSCCSELANWLSPRLFKALADPVRVAILARLAEGRREQTVSELAKQFPVHLSVVSRHLGILRDADIVMADKRGKEVFYRVRIGALSAALRGLADALDACCPDESDAIERRASPDDDRGTAFST